jgi:cation diffusion facilitator CzcD-associated flavoprotein CzcO
VLVTEPIERITADAVVTTDGRIRRFDTLIYATGFATTKYLSALDVRGRGGKRIDDAWNDGAIAYLGITTVGFPNLFMLYGPNTNNGSILEMIESQVAHVLAQVERVPVWQASCNGYYRAPSGRIVTQWPGSMSSYKARTQTLDRQAFEVGRLEPTTRQPTTTAR